MKYFTIPELTASAKARTLGIDNTPAAGCEDQTFDTRQQPARPDPRKVGRPDHGQQRLSVPGIE